MKLSPKFFVIVSLVFFSALSATFAGAQQKAVATPQVNLAYDVARESVVQGTVISYTPGSNVGPIGPHAMIQTSAGPVDVHLGNAVLLKQNEIFLAAGDSVKIVGQSVTLASGPVVLARVLQKGSQTVTLRNVNGIPLAAKSSPNAKPRTLVGVAR